MIDWPLVRVQPGPLSLKGGWRVTRHFLESVGTAVLDRCARSSSSINLSLVLGKIGLQSYVVHELFRYNIFNGLFPFLECRDDNR